MPLSKSRREGVRKLLRRNFDTDRATTGIVQTHDELERFFHRLAELHQKRRISLGESGRFESPRFRAFHLDVMQQMLSLGLLQLTAVRPPSSTLLVGGDTVNYYQCGIEPALAKECPGWLSTIGSLRDAFNQGFRYFDFLRGDEAYKASWGATPHPARELRIVAPRLKPRLRYSAWRTRKLFGRLKRAFHARFRERKHKTRNGKDYSTYSKSISEQFLFLRSMNFRSRSSSFHDSNHCKRRVDRD